MSNVTLKARLVSCSKTSAEWAQSANSSLVPLRGEVCIETFTDAAPKIKIGDGTKTWAELPYATLTATEIQALITSTAYNLPKATSSVLGGVMVGTNVDVDSDGKISVKDASTSQKGVVQLSDAIDSTSTTLSSTANATKRAYDRGSLGVTNAATAQSAAEAAQTKADQAYDLAGDKIGSVTLAGGTNNGTVKLTVDGTATDNIAVTGLKSAAYTEASAYATAAQGTKADNAMPKSGGTFTGAVTLNADPTTNLGAATKQYVDSTVNAKIAASDAMVFKGVISASGSITALPTTNVVVGDTYKVGDSSMTLAGYSCRMGDLLIALNSGSVAANSTNWAYVPSGNENETTIKYSTTTQNLTTSAQTGAITVGEAATKQVDSSVTVGTTSTKLPTSAAVSTFVKDFVEGKGYSTTDENVKQTSSTTSGNYPILASASTSPTSGAAAKAIYNTGVTFNPSTKVLTATEFNGKLNANHLIQTASEYLILDGNFS